MKKTQPAFLRPSKAPHASMAAISLVATVVQQRHMLDFSSSYLDRPLIVLFQRIRPRNSPPFSFYRDSLYCCSHTRYLFLECTTLREKFSLLKVDLPLRELPAGTNSEADLHGLSLAAKGEGTQRCSQII